MPTWAGTDSEKKNRIAHRIDAGTANWRDFGRIELMKW